jgi:hypothetical protein
VPLFRRERLHDRLAREGGLGRPLGSEPIDTTPRWGVTGIHGIPRPRRWDAVVAAESPDLPGERVSFVTLTDGSLVVDEDVPEGALEPLAEALDEAVDAPYRAEAVRQDGPIWAAAARRIEVVELPDVEGDELSLTVQDGGRRFLIDGNHGFGGSPELERVAGARYDSYVAEATRLDGDLFELRLTPL